MDLEWRRGLEVVLRARDVRVVVADKERLARLGEKAGGEEEADAAEMEKLASALKGEANKRTHKGTNDAKRNSDQRRVGQAIVSRTVTAEGSRSAIRQADSVKRVYARAVWCSSTVPRS